MVAQFVALGLVLGELAKKIELLLSVWQLIHPMPGRGNKPHVGGVQQSCQQLGSILTLLRARLLQLNIRVIGVCTLFVPLIAFLGARY